MALVYQISHNIVSGLGLTSELNFNSVISGRSGLKYYPENTFGVPEAFCASILDHNILNGAFSDIGNSKKFNHFDKLSILSAYKALQDTEIDPTSPDTLFILSTTKGNIDLLESRNNNAVIDKQLFLWQSAKIIADFFKNPNKPLVVSNACISGISAQIVAKRLLLNGKFKHIIVIGTDIVSKFVVAGFQSFKALSPENCLPFDIDRKGLNIGEAAATIIYGIKSEISELEKNSIYLDAGAITNDVNHISGPSRTAEGLTLAIESVQKSSNMLVPGFISAHGTATPFNDEMEALAITRCGLQNVPTFSLKGYFGHTLGAAGLVETIISSMALKNNLVIKSLGYSNCGVPTPITIATETVTLESKSFLKTISGFGGCNAAVLFKKS